MRRTTILAALFLLAASCGGSEKPAPATQDQAPAASPAIEQAMTAARVANAIEAMPASADSILTAAGYTAESFQQLMFDIAADSAMSAAYAAARVK